MNIKDMVDIKSFKEAIGHIDVMIEKEKIHLEKLKKSSFNMISEIETSEHVLDRLGRRKSEYSEYMEKNSL